LWEKGGNTLKRRKAEPVENRDFANPLAILGDMHARLNGMDQSTIWENNVFAVSCALNGLEPFGQHAEMRGEMILSVVDWRRDMVRR